MRVAFILLFVMFRTSMFAQTYTIHGTVRDSSSGEAVIGATVTIKELNIGAAANSYGFYAISLKPGNYTICCSCLGYKSYIAVVNLKSDLLFPINLSASVSQLNEVIVSSSNSRIKSPYTSKNVVEIGTIKSITSITGEPDVLKSLQLLPGVQTAHEGSTNFNVRGGSFDQNLILLDEAPVYNASHCLGFFSTFNTDAINSVTFYKGCYPAQYGGRLSSVVDISMKEGNNKTFHASGGIGIVASRLTIEGPLIHSKASFIISGRYSYAGQTLNLLAGEIGHKTLKIYSLKNFNTKNEINFYDFNAKINYQINNNNHVYLSVYSGGDHFYSYALNSENALDWGNLTSTLRWNHIFSNKLFSNFTLYHSDYKYSYYIADDLQNYIWKSSIRETGLKNDYTLFVNTNNSLKFGINAITRVFQPGKVEPRSDQSLTNAVALDKKYNNEFSVYLEDEINLNNSLRISMGLRHTLFFDMGPATVYNYNSDKTLVSDSMVYDKNKIVRFYQGFEPRASIRCLINQSNSVKISYAHVYQYLHLLSNSSAGLPTDTWIPADKYIKPQSSHQFVVGYYASLWDGGYLFTVENYYKTLQNIVDFKDNADLFLNKHVETQVLQGKGYSYGSEFMLEKKSGKLNGWVAYTLNKTQYKIDGINSNNYYSPRYDIRHNLSVIGLYKLSKRWSFTSTFKITSGGYATIPEGTFIYNHIAFPYYNGRNGYKLPAYHRLDISFNYKSAKNEKRRFKSEWSFSIYNVYNHKNIYAMFIRQDDEWFAESKAYAMYLFGIVPTVSYNFNF